MSVWSDEHVLDAVIEALESVHMVNPDGHHLGRPFLTSYQLAIKIDAAHPNIRAALTNHELGGTGTGARHSFAQYLGRELSRRIKRDDDYPVQGAFLSNEHVTALSFADAHGSPFTSSVTGTGYDLGLFRLAAPADSGDLNQFAG